MWAVPFIGPGRAYSEIEWAGPGRLENVRWAGPGRGYSEIEWAGAGPGRLKILD